MNPEYIIRKVEIGTSSLIDRIDAANKLFSAGYRVGVNLAPIILVDNWKALYTELLHTLREKLNTNLHKQMFMELIFMTYGYANMAVNKAAMPTAMDVFNRENMKPKGRGKYMYKPDIKDEAESYVTALTHDLFPYADISYIV